MKLGWVVTFQQSWDTDTKSIVGKERNLGDEGVGSK